MDFKKFRHGTSIVATRCQLRLIRRTLSVINWTVVGRTRLTILAKVDVRPTTVDSLSHQASTPLSTAQLASGSKSRPCATAYTCFPCASAANPIPQCPRIKINNFTVHTSAEDLQGIGVAWRNAESRQRSPEMVESRRPKF